MQAFTVNLCAGKESFKNIKLKRNVHKFILRNGTDRAKK